MDDKGLSQISMTVNGPAGNKTFTQNISGTSKNLSSYYFNSSDTNYADKPGTYTVTLSISDTSGNKVSTIFNILINNIASDTFPETEIKTKNTNSAYGNSLNAFKNLQGQCTWYTYGRIIELSDAGYLNYEIEEIFYKAFWGKWDRHAKNWLTFIGGDWFCTNSKPLAENKRKKGLVAVWSGGEYGHVGFVEEISKDKKSYRLSDFNRGGQEKYSNKWYNFEGKNDYLVNSYPCFFDLDLLSNKTTSSTWYEDYDNDGYGNPNNFFDSDIQPNGYVADNTDCDDTDNTVYPGATETPGDGIDQDCDGQDAALDVPSLTVTTSGVNVSLSWTSVLEADGYILYYAPPDISYIDDIDMGTETSISLDLWEGAAFYVGVKAYNSSGSSGYSNIEFINIVNSVSSENAIQLSSYHDSSLKFVFSKKITEQTNDYLIAQVRLLSGAGCWYMVSPNFSQSGSGTPISKTDVYYLPPLGNIEIDNAMKFEKDQYYQLDINRGDVGAYTLTALDVIMRGIFSKKLEDVLTSDTEKISLLINAVKQSGLVGKLDTGTAYFLNGEYFNAVKDCVSGFKEIADLIGHDKMEQLFVNVVGQSGKMIWEFGITTIMDTIGLFDKYFLLKEIYDNYIANPGPLDAYVRLEAH